MEHRSRRQNLIDDLVWAIESQPLLLHQEEVQTPGDSSIRHTVDPDHLGNFFTTGVGVRVGRYFERLILYWLSHVRNCTDISHSIQITEAGRTIGEIDFLYTDESGQRCHLESAVKFYLFHPERCVDGCHYIGGNCVDTLARKSARLFDHQLQLSAQRFPDITVRRAHVRGTIFYPHGHPGASSSPGSNGMVVSEHLAPQHDRGVWLPSDQAEALETLGSGSWMVLPKPHWLSGQTPPEINCLGGTPDEMVLHIHHHFAQSERPLMLCVVEQEDEEIPSPKRAMIVPRHWPDRAPPN